MIGFAHRGAARTRSEQNTLPAFERALALGAGGLETDVGLTCDGVPVLVHPRVFLRREPPVSHLRRDQLPPHIPTLADLYERCGNDFELSLDMGYPQAADAVVRVATEHGAAGRLWMTYWRLPTLELWRRRWPALHLVYPTIPLGRRHSLRQIERLAALRVDALNVYHRVCTPSLVEMAHRHGLLLFAWGVRSRRPLERIVADGADGVYCDDVQTMVRVVGPTGDRRSMGRDQRRMGR